MARHNLLIGSSGELVGDWSINHRPARSATG